MRVLIYLSLSQLKHELKLAIGLGYRAGLKNLNAAAIPIEVENEIINSLNKT